MQLCNDDNDDENNSDNDDDKDNDDDHDDDHDNDNDDGMEQGMKKHIHANILKEPLASAVSTRLACSKVEDDDDVDDDGDDGDDKDALFMNLFGLLMKASAAIAMHAIVTTENNVLFIFQQEYVKSSIYDKVMKQSSNPLGK